MERIGLANLLGNLFQAGGDNVAPIFCLLDLLGVFVGDVGDDALVGKYIQRDRQLLHFRSTLKPPLVFSHAS